MAIDLFRFDIRQSRFVHRDGTGPGAHGLAGFQHGGVAADLQFFGSGIPGHDGDGDAGGGDKYGDGSCHLPVHRIGGGVAVTEGRDVEHGDEIE